MIIPGSYAISLAILILGMLCWSSWANTLKLAGPKWRFELFYIDFAVGVFLAAIIAGFTVGSMGWDGFSLIDDLHLAGKRQELFGFLAGCLFNLANILLVGSVSLTGLAFAFPITMGLGLVVAAATGLVLNPGPNVLFTSAACIVILIAVGFAAMAWRHSAASKPVAVPDPAKTKAPVRRFSLKGIVVAVIGGLLMGSFYPLVGMAREGENGLGPYSFCLVFAAGVFFSTLVFDLFFMNIPLQGKPVEMSNYFKGGARQHLLGLLGGMLWLAGTLAFFVAERAEGPARVPAGTASAVGQIAVVLAALWGLISWKELAGAGPTAKTFIAATLFLYLIGIVLFYFAASYAAH